MIYELAKKLRDAGFPQSVKEDGSNVFLGEGNPVDPTLSELIEACGDRFSCLWHIDGKWIAKWFVDLKQVEFGSGDVLIVKGEGSTPEEAVANLWLSLPDKK